MNEPEKFHGVGRFIRMTCARILICVLLMNSLFFLVLGSRSLVNIDTINTRLMRAFLDDTLLYNDWSSLDSLRGMDQFSDAVMFMQLQTRPAHWYDWIVPSWPRTLGDDTLTPSPRPLPWKKVTDSPSKGLLWMTSEVRHQLDENRELPQPGVRMHRYWEGTLPISAWLLSVFDLRVARLLLIHVAYLSVILLSLAALRVSREAFACFLPITSYGILFAEIPYLGQQFMHAGFSIGILAIIGVIMIAVLRGTLGALTIASAAAGAIAVFFDQLNGTALQMGCLIIPAAFYLARARKIAIEGIPAGRLTEITYVATACASFIAGGVLSLLLYYLFQCAVFGFDEAFLSTIKHFHLRMGGRTALYESLSDSYGALYSNLRLMTYGNKYIAIGLIAISLMAWLASMPPLMKSILDSLSGRKNDYWVVFAINLLAALTILGWYAVFRNHTKIHAFFMVRFLYLPLAFGWSNLGYLWIRGR